MAHRPPRPTLHQPSTSTTLTCVRRSHVSGHYAARDRNCGDCCDHPFKQRSALASAVGMLSLSDGDCEQHGHQRDASWPDVRVVDCGAREQHCRADAFHCERFYLRSGLGRVCDSANTNAVHWVRWRRDQILHTKLVAARADGQHQPVCLCWISCLPIK